MWAYTVYACVLVARASASNLKCRAIKQTCHSFVVPAGGYDHTVKLWDVRSGKSGMSFDHGAPVEDLTFFPSGGLLVTAGGTNLCIWDLLR
jgi:WD40 repeat protein